MGAFAPKQHQPQKSVASNPAQSHTETQLQSDAEELNSQLTGVASPRFSHDFSRIPVHFPVAGAIQTKLQINQPGDEYEQEADHVANEVMRMPEPQLQRACACGGSCPTCQSPVPKRERLQTKRTGSSNLERTFLPSTIHEVLNSSGQPLDSASNAFMESRFSHDFSRVRVHSDTRAAKSAQEINALAYTVGHHIVFGEGQYQPQNREGQKLLAHELTHVIQQNSHLAESNHASAPALSLQRQDAGPGRRDAGADVGADVGAAPDSGRSPVGPATTPSSPAAPGLTASLIAMNTTGIVDPANCARNRFNRRGRRMEVPLGVYNPSISRINPWRNAIEFVWGITGAIGPGVTFDIKRVRGYQVCEIPRVGAGWRLVEAESPGTPDDMRNVDECLSPQPPGQRIFSEDSPGFPTTDPRDTDLLGGGRLSTTAVAVRLRYTFEEWVEATIPGVGTNVAISPRVPWHATISLDNATPAAASASWRRTPGEPNDIGAGSISLTCTGTPGRSTPGSRRPSRPPRPPDSGPHRH